MSLAPGRFKHLAGWAWHELTWQESLALRDQVSYWGVIPPEALTVLS